MWKLFSRKKECSTTTPEVCTGLQITGKEKALVLFVILHLVILLLNLFFFLRPEPEKKIEEKSGWFWIFMYENKPSDTSTLLLYNMIFFALSLFFTIFGYFCQIFFSALYCLCSLFIDLIYYAITIYWHQARRRREEKEKTEEVRKSSGWWWAEGRSGKPAAR